MSPGSVAALPWNSLEMHILASTPERPLGIPGGGGQHWGLISSSVILLYVEPLTQYAS